jgi:ferredoxin-NADP reductase
MPHCEVSLVYSARTAADFAYDDELQALAREGRIALHRTITRDGDVDWNGGRGRLSRQVLQPLVQQPDTRCFICGPLAFVQAALALLADLGVAPDQIVVEPWARRQPLPAAAPVAALASHGSHTLR